MEYPLKPDYIDEPTGAMCWNIGMYLKLWHGGGRGDKWEAVLAVHKGSKVTFHSRTVPESEALAALESLRVARLVAPEVEG